MDVIKKKHWWQSDALKWSVLGLLGLLVGYLVVLMYAQGDVAKPIEINSSSDLGRTVDFYWFCGY